MNTKKKKISSSIEALNLLIEGNHRFVNGLRSVESFQTMDRLKELAEKGQSPFAIVLTCSDSRVPTEMVFDQGLGDLFVIRVAGNIVAPSLLASIEFAVLSFETKLCVVMGHVGCGAIHTTVESELNQNKQLTPNLEKLIMRIRPAVKTAMSKSTDLSDRKALEHSATQENIRHSVEMIQKRSPLLNEYIEKERLLVVGSLYDIRSGKVEFDVPENLSLIQGRNDGHKYQKAVDSN
ncbi:MAG: carbonic anhydrase [Bdellovibrionota bacterium]